MIPEVWGLPIGTLQALQMFLRPSTLMADFNFINSLQPQAFFPHGHRHPQGPLVIFETVPTEPGGPQRKLDLVQHNKDIRLMGLVEKTGERREVWLVGGEDHR